MQAGDQIGVEGVGPIELVARVHAGSFEVYRARLGARDVCVKVAGEGEARATAFRARQSVVVTRLFSTHGSSGVPAEPPSASEMLMLEAPRIHESRGAWNHEVIAVGAVEGGTASTALVTPWHPGHSLGELGPKARQVLPGVTGWLWKALGTASHGDLHAENILVSPTEDAVALIDPAVYVYTSRSNDLGDSVLECSFTTNVEHYPILPPYAPGPLLPVRPLAAHFEELRWALSGTAPIGVDAFAGGPAACLAEPPRPDGVPLPADLLAVGILYYRALTGRHPFYDDAFDRPAWLGGTCIDSFRGRDTGFEGGLARLAREVVPPRAVDPTITEAESALCQALLELRVGSLEALEHLASDARRSHT